MFSMIAVPIPEAYDDTGIPVEIATGIMQAYST
jgi:hypothetical protein